MVPVPHDNEHWSTVTPCFHVRLQMLMLCLWLWQLPKSDNAQLKVKLAVPDQADVVRPRTD